MMWNRPVQLCIVGVVDRVKYTKTLDKRWWDGVRTCEQAEMEFWAYNSAYNNAYIDAYNKVYINTCNEHWSGKVTLTSLCFQWGHNGGD